MKNYSYIQKIFLKNPTLKQIKIKLIFNQRNLLILEFIF